MALEFTLLIIRIAGGLYLLMLVLHLLMRLADVDFYNPVTQGLLRWTTPATALLQKLLPNIGRLDLGILCTAILLHILIITVLLLLTSDIPFIDPLQLLSWSVIGICYMIADIYFYAIIALIVISWLAPNQQHPALDLLVQLTSPIVEPMRRVVPPLGGMDLSPILIFLIIAFVELMLNHLAVAVQLPPSIVVGI